MRSILNISLSEKALTEVKHRSKSRGFRSVSEYLRFLLEEDDGLISADDVLSMAKRADRDYSRRKLKPHASLTELLSS